MAFPSKWQHQITNKRKREKQTASSKHTDEINRYMAHQTDKPET